MQIPLLLDRSRPEPLAAQIVEQLRDAIRRMQIAPGARLPSSRRLAEQLDVSRNTVVHAYETLVTEGYAESRPASGIFVVLDVADPGQRTGLPALPSSDAEPSGLAAMPLPLLPVRSQDLVNQGRNRLAFDFFPGNPSTGLFPLKTWRRLLQGCLSHGGAIGLSRYQDPAGLPVLRAAIANHIAVTRGIIADVSRIIVVSGVQEGINIAARLFLDRGVIGAVEDPGYQGAAFAFEAAGARVVGVGLDADGVVLDDLPSEAALFYVTPAHQYPTGCTLSLARRHQLIAWARRNGCYIVEDDYDGDFRYDGSPLPAIASLAPDCTIHLGTFSKSLGAGLRLGYMVVPAPLADATRTTKALLNNGNPWLDQAALAELIRGGSYAAHLARIRAHYRTSRDSLVASLRRHFGDVEVTGTAGGLHLFWHLAPGIPDAQVLEEIARRVRVGIYPMASGAAHEIRVSRLSRRAIILGYAGLLPRQIEQAVARLSEALDDALEVQGARLLEPTLATVARRSPTAPAVDGTRPNLVRNFNRQPALRAGARLRAGSGRDITERGVPMPTVSGIYRYPVKGLSAQRLSSVALEAGQPFPHDRCFALTRPGVAIDPAAPKWAKKGLFVMLMLDEALARVKTNLDVDSLDFVISQGNQRVLEVNLASERQRLDVEEFFRQLVPGLHAAPRLVRANGGHFMDKPDNVLSLINLATVRSLEEQWGYEIDPLRFRANFYIEGALPWEEFDWIGSDITLGGALFRVDRRNGRCGATNVNPVTGRRDLDIPGSLRAAFGHKDLGVYLVTRKGGAVSVGDRVEVPHRRSADRMPTVVPQALVGERRFICRGCYFVYEEARGLPHQAIPAGTRFARIPVEWRCPDCGTEKSNFRPHVEGAPMQPAGQRR